MTENQDTTNPQDIVAQDQHSNHDDGVPLGEIMVGKAGPYSLKYYRPNRVVQAFDLVDEGSEFFYPEWVREAAIACLIDIADIGIMAQVVPVEDWPPGVLESTAKALLKLSQAMEWITTRKQSLAIKRMHEAVKLIGNIPTRQDSEAIRFSNVQPLFEEIEQFLVNAAGTEGRQVND